MVCSFHGWRAEDRGPALNTTNTFFFNLNCEINVLVIQGKARNFSYKDINGKANGKMFGVTVERDS